MPSHDEVLRAIIAKTTQPNWAIAPRFWMRLHSEDTVVYTPRGVVGSNAKIPVGSTYAIIRWTAAKQRNLPSYLSMGEADLHVYADALETAGRGRWAKHMRRAAALIANKLCPLGTFEVGAPGGDDDPHLGCTTVVKAEKKGQFQ